MLAAICILLFSHVYLSLNYLHLKGNKLCAKKTPCNYVINPSSSESSLEKNYLTSFFVIPLTMSKMSFALYFMDVAGTKKLVCGLSIESIL